jgi:hypothetical protein
MGAIGLNPTKAEAEIWMRENDGLYEYIAMYVDNLLIAAKDPDSLIKSLSENHKFNLKGVGKLTYHLGCDYFCDTDGTLCCGPRQYMIFMDQFKNMFGCKTREYACGG